MPPPLIALDPALIMAGVAATLALVATILFARRPRSPHGVYIRRIAGMMLIAASVILALFAWGLHRVAS